MKRALVFGASFAALLPAMPAFAGNGTPINSGSANVLTMAVYGDAPYGTTPANT